MTDTITNPPGERELRGALLCQLLHWLASGRISASALTHAYVDAIARENPALNAYVQVSTDAREQAQATDARRGRGAIGRLDGVPIAIKDNIDVAGLATRCGLPSRDTPVTRDAHVVERLRGAGAVILGKTNLDEGVLGAATNNPHFGATHNPFRHGFSAGGSSGGSAAAVAAGLCAAAIGSDTLGSIRIPASYCGIYALKPTHGEISVRGMMPGARRLDCIGLLARSVDDLSVLLHVLADYDAEDPQSRGRRVDLALPDWEPGKLRVGVLGDLAAFGAEAPVAALFERALVKLTHELPHRHIVDFSDFYLGKARRAAFFLAEAEMLVTYADALDDKRKPVSSSLKRLLDYARGKSAADYAAADRMLDTALLKSRRVFHEVDVLVTPTTPQAAFALSETPPDNQGDFTCFANLAGCPAVSIPMGMLDNGLPVGLQFIGPRGSDLRLLELAEVCAAALDAAPAYPVGA